MSRAVFYEEDDAEAVAGQLRGQGFDAAVAREAFAGEDDDEDRYWAVTTDAPDFVLEILAEPFDGWVDFAEDPTRTSAPIELPQQVKRRP